MPKTMRAACRLGYDDPLEVRERPRPRAGEGELLVRVHRATVNRTGAAVRSGTPFVMRFFVGLFRPRSPITGTDFVGTVVELGSGVTRFEKGARIAGFYDEGLGSHAEYVAVRADRPMVLVPESVSDEAAVAGLEGGHYALNFLNKVDLRPGARVMLNGGTGAIGSAAIQLLKLRGAQVVATCPGAYKETVLGLGADAVIDYEVEDFCAQATKFDFVFDAVGKSTFGRCKHLLNPGGTYISSELGPYGQNPFLALWSKLFGLGAGKRVVFPLPGDTQRSVDALMALLAEGTLRPLVEKTFPLAAVGDAFALVESGQKIGNVVVRIDE